MDFVHFLDLTFQGSATKGCVNTTSYRKPNSGNTILNANSCHPQCTICSIPTGEYTRIKRACSDEALYSSTINELNIRLKKRGYNHKYLKAAASRIHKRSRESLLFPIRNDNSRLTCSNSNPFVFSPPYSSDFPSLKRTIHKYLPILNKDPK